jgi:hypothetical protein
MLFAHLENFHRTNELNKYIFHALTSVHFCLTRARSPLITLKYIVAIFMLNALAYSVNNSIEGPVFESCVASLKFKLAHGPQFLTPTACVAAQSKSSRGVFKAVPRAVQLDQGAIETEPWLYLWFEAKGSQPAMKRSGGELFSAWTN